ncbi:MAG TPA: DUF2865 domain-containing protein [Bradyrhizobium sp.]|nr:DUF2865 domain-containing protein [Bradyrhizobium sp.]
MAVRNVKRWTIGVAAALAVATLVPPTQAQDFFSNFFRGFGRPRAPMQMPFGDNFQQPEPRQRASGSGQAYCVRTCDGRYFPITGNDSGSRTTACNSLCPKAETEVVYGSAIDDAATENGKPYSKLQNAFRYRNELVSGCTCNGKDSVGLAQIEPEKDPTLRKGDIVAGANGLVVANQSADKRGASVNFSPASERIKQRYRPPPVVAKGRN